MTNTKRDAVTKHISEEQSNGLRGKGIQTDKQHSFFFCTPKILHKNYFLKALFLQLVIKSGSFLSHQFKALLQGIIEFCSAARCAQRIFNPFDSSQYMEPFPSKTL